MKLSRSYFKVKRESIGIAREVNFRGKTTAGSIKSISDGVASKLLKDEVFDDSVFEVGKLSASQIYDSFSKRTSPWIGYK
jgi:hypothetical protein